MQIAKEEGRGVNLLFEIIKTFFLIVFVVAALVVTTHAVRLQQNYQKVVCSKERMTNLMGVLTCYDALELKTIRNSIF